MRILQTIDLKKYYYIVDKHTGKQRVAGADLMLQIQEQHTLKKAIKILERNISLQEKLISGYRPYDLDSIKQLLPKVYRSPPSIHEGDGGADDRSVFCEDCFPCLH